MRVIYSNTKIKGLEGTYKNPLFFDGIDPFADEVYTDDETIAEAYKKQSGVKIFNLKGKKFSTNSKKDDNKNADKGDKGVENA